MSFEDKKIAFIGAGVMGGTLISGLVKNSLVSPEQITAADPNEVRGQELVDTLGINYTTSNSEAAEDADIIVVGVKPQHIESALHELRGRVDGASCLQQALLLRGCKSLPDKVFSWCVCFLVLLPQKGTLLRW